ncbi:MAG: sigma-70 family RNA polymerase sigma factor [Dehalococcoidia bacterium]
MIARTQPIAAARSGSDERRLIAAARAGDRDAWSKLFRENFQPLYRYALVRVGRHHPAEELASQVFVEAFAGIARFRYRGVSIRAWLFKIARNLTADYLVRQARAIEETLRDRADSYEELEAAGLRVDVVRALDSLGDDQRQVVILRFLHGLSLAEAGHVLGRSADAITALQARGLTRMRQLLEEAPE